MSLRKPLLIPPNSLVDVFALCRQGFRLARDLITDQRKRLGFSFVLSLLMFICFALTVSAVTMAQDPAVIQLNDRLEKKAQEERDRALPNIFRSQAKVRPTRDVVIYVDSMGEAGYDAESFALENAYHIKWLRKQFPDHDIVSFTSIDDEKTRRSLEAIMKEYQSVKGLVVRSHGDTPDIDSKGEIQLSAWAASGTFDIDPTHKPDIEKVFGPVVGKFSDDAKIIFGGCLMLHSLSNLQKLKVLKKVGQNFELASGRVYMSETPVGNIVIQYFGTPFYKRRYDKRGVFMRQLLFPVTLPMAIEDNFKYNKGNTLKIEGGIASLYKDTFHNTLKHCLSKGEKSGSCLVGEMKTDRRRKAQTSNVDGSESSSIFINVAR